jgi:hypothetical protein
MWPATASVNLRKLLDVVVVTLGFTTQKVQRRHSVHLKALVAIVARAATSNAFIATTSHSIPDRLRSSGSRKPK